MFKPLGLNWKTGVALLSGVPAKEIIVSTLGVLYSESPTGNGTSEPVVEAADTQPDVDFAAADKTSSLAQRLRSSGDFSTAAAWAFLVFILLYFPCIATIGAIGKEAGWKWAAVAVLYDTALAWAVAWIVYTIA